MKVHHLPEGFSVKPPEGMSTHQLRTQANKLKEELPIMLEIQSHFAQITRAKYLALIAQGFTKEEALYLCK